MIAYTSIDQKFYHVNHSTGFRIRFMNDKPLIIEIIKKASQVYKNYLPTKNRKNSNKNPY